MTDTSPTIFAEVCEDYRIVLPTMGRTLVKEVLNSRTSFLYSHPNRFGRANALHLKVRRSHPNGPFEVVGSYCLNELDKDDLIAWTCAKNYMVKLDQNGQIDKIWDSYRYYGNSNPFDAGIV